jgi:hypothetical protein
MPFASLELMDAKLEHVANTVNPGRMEKPEGSTQIPQMIHYTLFPLYDTSTNKTRTDSSCDKNVYLGIDYF